MMMGRRIPQEIFKRNPSQSLSGIVREDLAINLAQELHQQPLF